MKGILIFSAVIYMIKLVLTSKILAIIPSPSLSHQVPFQPLWKALSLRGHNVTIGTTNPMNNLELKNLTEIDLHKAYKYVNGINVFDLNEKPTWEMMLQFLKITYNFINENLKHPVLQLMINDRKEHFDLVMVEAFHTAALAFAVRFNCPLILISSLDVSLYAYQQIRHQAHPVLQPDYSFPYQENLSFSERLKSGISVIVMQYYKHLFVAHQQILVEKYFGKNYPGIKDIFNNYSLLFINANSFLQPIRALLPNVVQIGGGLHIREPRPLPKDLQHILDKSIHGVIYFSLGNNVKSKYLPNNVHNEIMEVFQSLPYTVLWKFEVMKQNISENVIISKWFPQQDILRHRNIKLFITQGGLQSLEEAILNHIPIIGIPALTDQTGNINRMVTKGIGIKISYKNLTRNNLKHAILEVINNDKYRRNVKILAKHIKDQQESGLQRAVWWTEYILKTKGAPHLKNPALDLYWYEYYLLDVLIAYLLVFLIICHFLYRNIKSFVKNIYK